MEYVFISVNFNSSYLIEPWIKSIRTTASNFEIIIVDNFSTSEEREKVRKLAELHLFELIELENVGYSKAMNKALISYKKKGRHGVIFCGNLDIIFLKIPKNLTDGSYVYIPMVKEKNRINRNPFLTVFQKNILPFYKLAAKNKSIPLYYLAITLNKLAGFFPSRIWAIHGSLFCFNSSLIKGVDNLPFNSSSFLYGEELEFASFIESKNGKFIKTGIVVKHISNATTSKLIKNQKDYINLWAPSFINFLKRWKL